jgi:hypothetical protein
MSIDAIAYDQRPGYCWRCNAVPALGSLGCCDKCVADLRAGGMSPPIPSVTGEDLQRLATSLAPTFRAFGASMRRVVLAVQPAIKQMAATMEAAGFRYVEGHGWLPDPDHDPRTFGPPPGSLRRNRRR